MDTEHICWHWPICAPVPAAAAFVRRSPMPPGLCASTGGICSCRLRGTYGPFFPVPSAPPLLSELAAKLAALQSATIRLFAPHHCRWPCLYTLLPHPCPSFPPHLLPDTLGGGANLAIIKEGFNPVCTLPATPTTTTTTTRARPSPPPADTLAGADLTIMEEGFELLERLEGLVSKRTDTAPLPMFTSCCPVSSAACCPQLTSGTALPAGVALSCSFGRYLLHVWAAMW